MIDLDALEQGARTVLPPSALGGDDDLVAVLALIRAVRAALAWQESAVLCDPGEHYDRQQAFDAALAPFRP